jgi:DUF2917 family protein
MISPEAFGCETCVSDKDKQMDAREFRIGQGEILRIDAARGDRLHVRSGDVWVTQHGDSKDYVLGPGQWMTLIGEGATLAMAYKPTLLGWHRAEPRAAREPTARVVIALLREIFA